VYFVCLCVYIYQVGLTLFVFKDTFIIINFLSFASVVIHGSWEHAYLEVRACGVIDSKKQVSVVTGALSTSCQEVVTLQTLALSK
jgi:hypothetical protein